MPRYRFAWTNSHAKFLGDLAAALGLASVIAPSGR